MEAPSDIGWFGSGCDARPLPSPVPRALLEREQLHHETLSQWADAEIRLERPGAVLAELRAALLTVLGKDFATVEDARKQLVEAHFLTVQPSV